MARPPTRWWGSFLHSFVVPNSGWIGFVVAFAEFPIGVGLVLGLFTRVAALGSLALLFTYVMSGTASVCAFYALVAIVILATWRTSSLFGADGFIAGYRQRQHHVPTTRQACSTRCRPRRWWPSKRPGSTDQDARCRQPQLAAPAHLAASSFSRRHDVFRRQPIRTERRAMSKGVDSLAPCPRRKWK